MAETKNTGIESTVTGKGFKIIILTRQHILNIGGTGNCDWCMASIEEFWYVGALNCAFCTDCFDGWHRGAKYYPEDAEVEERRINRMVHSLTS